MRHCTLSGCEDNEAVAGAHTKVPVISGNYFTHIIVRVKIILIEVILKAKAHLLWPTLLNARGAIIIGLTLEQLDAGILALCQCADDGTGRASLLCIIIPLVPGFQTM
jgi:hypothetical protein